MIFLNGSKALGMGTLNTANGVTRATLSANGLAVGSHTIMASYGGDANFTASVTSGLTQIVQRDATTSVIAASVNPSVCGQAVTLTATVTASIPGLAAPSGTVTFTDGGTLLGSGVS